MVLENMQLAVKDVMMYNKSQKQASKDYNICCGLVDKVLDSHALGCEFESQS